MKKNGPLKIVVTTYKCTPCKNLKETKTQKCCNHKILLDNNISIENRLINNILITPYWCPVLQKRR